MGTPIGAYSLPVVTRGVAEPQESGGIAWAWVIVHSKVYHGICDKMGGQRGFVSFPNILHKKNDKIYYKRHKRNKVKRFS